MGFIEARLMNGELVRVVAEAEAITREAADRASVRWDLIGERGFRAAEQAARSVSRSFSNIEEDDVYQEALIYIATHADEIEHQAEWGASAPGRVGGDIGAQKAVTSHMISRMRRWAEADMLQRERELAAALAVVPEEPDLGLFRNRPTPPGFDGAGYTPAIVESVLPMVFDAALVGEGRDERQAPPDMPKGSGNKARQGTWMAHLADVRKAWRCAPVTYHGRQVVMLSLGMGYTQERSAEFLNVEQSTISRRYTRAIYTMAEYLNGKAVTEENDEWAA